MGKTIAVTTILGVAVMTVADAPDWDVNAYAGWLAAMTALAFLGQGAPAMAQGLAGLLLAALLLGPRGELAIRRLASLVGAT